MEYPNLMKKNSKEVVVLGMHRSGTSMVAGILHKLGVHMGDEMLGKNKSNPTGHFEDVEFFTLSERILKAAGGKWQNPPQKEKILKAGKKFSEEIKHIIEKKSKRKIWGWKDPRTCLTIDLFYPFLKNPYFVVVRREIEGIARSLEKRGDMCFEEGKKLAKRYIEDMERFLSEYKPKRVIEVHYRDFYKDPMREIKKLVNFLEIETTKEQLKNAREHVVNKSKIELSRKLLMPIYENFLYAKKAYKEGGIKLVIKKTINKIPGLN